MVDRLHRLDGVHGIRGLAAAGIVLFHMQAIPHVPAPAIVAGLIGHLYLAVHLFFVLSAFALSHAAASSQQTYSSYLIKRFFRIAPLFYLLIAWNVHRTGLPDISTLVANISFTFNLFPGLEQSLVWAGWSVGVEMLFYLFFPILFVAFGRPFLALAGFALSVFLSWFFWSLWQHDPRFSSYVYFFAGSNLADFFAGVCAYRLFALTAPLTRRRALGLLAFVTSATLLTVGYWDPLGLHARAAGLYFAAWSVPFALLCLSQGLEPLRFFSLSALQWLGDRSFSIYLFHPIVIELSRPLYQEVISKYLIPADLQYLSCALITLPVLFLISEVSYRLIEIPGMKLGRRLANVVEFRAKAFPANAGEGAGPQRN